MRFALILAVSATAALAQHVNVINPSRGMPPPINAHRYGNILFPGGITKSHYNSHPSRLGATVGGFPHPGINGGYPNGGFPRGGHGRSQSIVVPYAVPVWFGGGYYGAGYAEPQPNITVVVPQQPAPNVIINHNYSGSEAPQTSVAVPENTESSLRVYEGPQPQREIAGNSKPAAAPVQRTDDRPNIYLIALKDSTVRQALGYWITDTTLHYVTPQGTINHVSTDLVDREASENLNAQRKLEFDLKSAVR